MSPIDLSLTGLPKEISAPAPEPVQMPREKRAPQPSEKPVPIAPKPERK